MGHAKNMLVKQLQVEEAEAQTSGGLLMASGSSEKPTLGKVMLPHCNVHATAKLLADRSAYNITLPLCPMVQSMMPSGLMCKMCCWVLYYVQRTLAFGCDSRSI